jgi:hypothetical protein
MKANELRIGNYVNEYGRIICIESGHDIDLMFEEFQPIPLTPEILEQCGFVNKPSGIYKYSYEIEIDGFDSTFRTWWYGEDICLEPMGYDTGYISIKYLHQLQNLFYALTGEELTVNASLYA